MKKLGDAMNGCWDDAGHMGRGRNSEALPPCTPPSKELINLNLASQPPPPYNPPPSFHDSARLAGFSRMVAEAGELGIPEWYVDFWYRDLAANGWRTKAGWAVTRENWKRMLSSFWRTERDSRKAQIEAEYLAAQKKAEEDLKDPEPVIEFTARHWWGCQRACANFREGKCVCGGKRPASFCACNDGFTEKCRAFKPIPLEWQHVWKIAPEFWEPHELLDWRGRPWMHPGWKTTPEGRAVKAYFDAHPDELAAARARDEANEPTDAECADSKAYLAWVSRARRRTKEAKEAGKTPRGRD